MRKILPVAVVLGGFAVSACAGMSDTQQRTVSGGAIGAGAGAVGAAVTGGSAVTGGILGGAAGAGAGYLYDQHQRGNL